MNLSDLKYLCFTDTETTGFISKSVGPNDPKQVKTVQLGSIITDNKGNLLDTLDLVIKPNGYQIPTQASDIHGFTTDIALRMGITRLEVFTRYEVMRSKYELDLDVMHNAAYDHGVLSIESQVGGFQWQPKRLFCTMEETTNILKLPGRFGKYKWPKLIEAYKHFFNEDLECAHNAMADVFGCARVFFALHGIDAPHLVADVRLLDDEDDGSEEEAD